MHAIFPMLATASTEYLPVWQYILYFAGMLFFLLLNAFFVAAEFAIVKVRPSQVETVSKLKPKPEAKYVQFLTHIDRTAMVGLSYGGLDWPYSEALQMNEAKNDLAFIAVGAYGKAMKQQNGAPIRTVLPWKYGYKGTKSIATIRFTTTQPATAWNMAAPREYGFFSNVNPNRSHPRWSQAQERVLGVGGFNPQRKTEMFNGYEKQVAYLYEGIDLIKYH